MGAALDVVQQGYAAFGRRDIPALLKLIADEVDWKEVCPATRMGAVGNLSYRDAVIVARQFTAWGLCENKTRPVGYGVIGGSETGHV
jgi:ketosteroid isomerase-like protein